MNEVKSNGSKMERGKLDQEYALNIRILVSVTGFDYLSSGLPTLFTRSVLFKMFNRLTGLKKKIKSK